MSKAVQIGAGSIGRGFIGQLFSLSGYELVFVELDPRMVAALNQDRRYPLRVISGQSGSETWIEGVRAVSALDAAAVAGELAGASVVGTAVGAGALAEIAPVLAAGLELRWRSGNLAPLNIILCENLVDADAVFRNLVASRLTPADRELLGRLVGFVRASVGRMVPVMTPQMCEGNILRIWAEEYDHLLVDAEGFAGPVPPVRNMEPVAPFDYYIQRKLYIHNMGHAAAAYLGALGGCRFIGEAMGVPAIAGVVRAAMRESATAIAAEHRLDEAPLFGHIDELLGRFANTRVAGTVERVGQDLPRKLAPRDRFMGPIAMCRKWGLPRGDILEALAAGLLFDDCRSTALRDEIARSGAGPALERFCGLDRLDPDASIVLERYEALRGGLLPAGQDLP